MYGDSITDCGRPMPEGEGCPAFSPWGTGYVNLVAGLLGACYPELNIRVINKGTSGDQVRDLLARFDTDVAPLHPDVISILIGANDAWRCFDCPAQPEKHVSVEEYAQELDTLAERCLALTGRVVLMAPFHIETNPDDPMRRKLREFASCAQDVAVRRGLVFVDLQEPFDALLQHMHPYALSWDRVHPNVVGHMTIARSFLAAVGADRC